MQRRGITVAFDPCGGAGWRDGTDPDRLTGVLEELGFDLSTEELDPADPGYHYDDLWQERTFALVEHVTGVRLTPEMLAGATFRCAAVPDERRLAWLAEDPAHTAPYTLDEVTGQARARLAGYADGA